MREETRREVETFWRDVFDVPEDQLWRQVSVCHPHAALGAYQGWYVAWREQGVHVSAPSTADAADVASLVATSATELQDPGFWRARGGSPARPGRRFVRDHLAPVGAVEVFDDQRGFPAHRGAARVRALCDAAGAQALLMTTE